MKIKHIGISLAVISALGLGFAGCGSSSSSPTVVEGTFIDAPVYGLSYKTATQSGFTDSSGKFKYVAGETVEFKLGNLSFGTVSAGKLMTPYTMAGDTNTSAPSAKALNIAMLLQSLDANRSNSGTLDISKIKNFVFSDINLTSSPANMIVAIDYAVSEIESHGQFGSGVLDGNTTAISSVDALAAMKTYVDAEIAKLETPASGGSGLTIDTTKHIDLFVNQSVALHNSMIQSGYTTAVTSTCISLGYTLLLGEEPYESQNAVTNKVYYHPTSKTSCNEVEHKTGTDPAFIGDKSFYKEQIASNNKLSHYVVKKPTPVVVDAAIDVNSTEITIALNVSNALETTLIDLGYITTTDTCRGLDYNTSVSGDANISDGDGNLLFNSIELENAADETCEEKDYSIAENGDNGDHNLTAGKTLYTWTLN